MTHQNDYTFASDLMEKGLEAVPELLRVLINNVMQVERSKYLQAGESSAPKTGKVTPTGISQRRSELESARSLLRYRKFVRAAFTLLL